MTASTRVRVAHPTRRDTLPTLHPTQTRKPALSEAQEAMRRAEREAEAVKHERAYYLHVVLPLSVAGYPAPRAQYKGLIPGRRFVYDWAFVEARIVVEIQGQIWRKGGHTSGQGVTRDAVKVNEATALGWRCLIFTPEMIASGEARDYTERALRAAGFRTR